MKINIKLNNHSFGWPALGIEPPDTLALMRIDVHIIDQQVDNKAELPGVKKKDMRITLRNNILAVSVTKNTESAKAGKDNII